MSSGKRIESFDDANQSNATMKETEDRLKKKTFAYKEM